jgi:hypothetical protein
MSVQSWTDTAQRLVEFGLACFMFVRKYDCAYGVYVYSQESAASDQRISLISKKKCC